MPAGRRVTLTINDLRLEDTAACSFDYVEVTCHLTCFVCFVFFNKLCVHCDVVLQENSCSAFI